MKLLGFIVATGSLAALLWCWLMAGIPRGASEIAMCVFVNFVWGVAVPAVGIAMWMSADDET